MSRVGFLLYIAVLSPDWLVGFSRTLYVGSFFRYRGFVVYHLLCWHIYTFANHFYNTDNRIDYQRYREESVVRTGFCAVVDPHVKCKGVSAVRG